MNHQDMSRFVASFCHVAICLLHLVVVNPKTHKRMAFRKKHENLMFRDVRKIYPGMPSVKLISEALPGEGSGVELRVTKGSGEFLEAIWVFPKIGVPPNHPF